MPHERDIGEAIRVSRRRRGVPEQELGDNVGNDSTQTGQNNQNPENNRTSHGCNMIPPAPATHAAKTVLIPSGDRNWCVQNFNKKDRVPSTILGALLKHHYPQIVYDTTGRPPSNVAATKWRHWCMKGQQDGTCADRARYKWTDNEPKLKNKWMTTLEACCTKLASEAIYDLRIYAVMAYKTEIEEEIIEFEAAKLIHLHAHEYRQVPFSWINIDAWNELCNWWGSDQFRTMSAMKRGARLSRPETVNCGGSRSVTRTQQCLEATYGRPFSLIEGFAVHMGASKQVVAEGDGTELPPLTNEHAQEYLDNYHDGMRQVYGENVEWVRAPFDAQVMYDNTRRKPHGKFAIADGAVDSSEVQFSTNAHPSQSQSSIQRERELVQQVQDVKRQHQEDHNLFWEALLKFNEDMAQYMRQGCANAPPPQINLASLFPDHVQPSESGSMGNSSVNATLPRTGGSRPCQQPPPNIYQQGTMENNFVDVASRRMNGSSFNHATRQTFSAFLQQVGIGNGFDNMELQRMDGSNFRYATEQATPNTSRHESMQNYSRNVSVERMGRSATGNEGTPTNNYHNSQMRDGDENEDGVFF